MGKILIFIGTILIIAGVVMHFGLKIPFLGKLPGDIVIKRDGYNIYIPIMTCLVLSLIISLFLYIINKFRGH